MATSSIGQVVKLDNDTAKIFAEAMKEPCKPVRVSEGNGMAPLTDLSVLKRVK